MRNQDSASRTFLYTSVFWLIGGSLTFLLSMLEMASPSLLGAEIFGYAQMRSASSVMLQFGWLQLGALAAIFYVMPRVCGVPIRSESAGVAAGVLINLSVMLGVLVNLFAGVAGHEFGELPPYLFGVIVFAQLIVALNVLGTLKRRTEPAIYTSAWFFVGATLWTPIALAVTRIPTWSGVRDSIADMFAFNAMTFLFFVPAAMGAIYYLLPRAAAAPLYSHRLAMIGFWTLAFAGAISGEARRVHGPSQSWLQTIAIAGAIGLLLPALTLAVNVFGTLRGSERASSNPSTRFFAAGTIFFVLGVLAQAATAFRSVARAVGTTEVVTGTSWLLILGAFGLWFAGTGVYLIPRIMGRRWHSLGAISSSLWLSCIGAALVAASMWAAGGLEAAVVNAGVATQVSLSAGKGFDVVLAAVWRLRWLGLAGALLYLAGQWLFGLTLLRTTTSGETRPVEIVSPEVA